MKKVIKQISDIFEKYDCHSLYDLEKQSESFGNSEYDNYYYGDLVFTKYSLEDGQFRCFMACKLKTVDLDKAIFKIGINEERTFYALSFKEEDVLLLAGEEMNKCKKMIEKINEELGKIELNEDE